MVAEFQLIVVLLVAYQIKHYVADFPLQREYMLKKTHPGWEFLWPLSLHCGVHAILSLMIILLIRPGLWWLALFDFAAHFAMDRIKSGPRYLGRFNDKNMPSFWNCLGFDQMFHHLTHYAIIITIVVDKFPHLLVR